MFEVGDQAANILLNIAFFAILGLALLALVPWKLLGQAAIGRLMRWAWLPAVMLGAAYESLMPPHMNIRIDLLILLPAYAIIILTCGVRWWLARSNRLKAVDPE